ncbi:MAG: carbohydrate-binding family 9-like protein [Ginsengibacter sp.]
MILQNKAIAPLIIMLMVIGYGAVSGHLSAGECEQRLIPASHELNDRMLDSDTSQKNFPVYLVKKLKEPMNIDGNWNKAQWSGIKPVELTNYMGKIPPFRPIVYVKMMYDENSVYVIFQVHDRYVRSVIEEYNGPVSTEACVEFFFSPDTSMPDRYFNLEINAGGTPLMGYHIYPQKESRMLSVEDLKKIEISHSLPKRVDPEIDTAIIWTIEYKLPFSVLEKFGSITQPKPGVTWRANFYKTASQSSNPHYITWSLVDNAVPNFHLPRFFGQIKFEK